MVKNAPRPYIKNLDALPMPDRAAINLKKYVDTWRAYHGRGSLSLICARGCPFHCAWCSHAVYGETHRRHSPERIADELQQLIEMYQPDQVWYADDVFTIHPGWLFKYAGELKRRGIKMPFECISRPERLNDQVIDTLAEMGCYRLWIGSESGSPRILDAMRRDVTVEQVRWATRALQKRGIEVGMFIMLGFEGEEVQDIQATMEHLKMAAPNTFLTTVAYPIKGTPYHEQVKDRISARADWDHHTDRDLTVRGRPSRRFYEYAQRWMSGEFNWHQQSRHGRKDWVRLLKSAASIAIGRVGMALRAKEKEI